jgi:hypothetical protein
MAGSEVIYSRSSDLRQRRALQGTQEATIGTAKKVRAVLITAAQSHQGIVRAVGNVPASACRASLIHFSAKSSQSCEKRSDACCAI